MPQVMRERHGFDQVLVQAKIAANAPGELRHLKRMRQTRAIIIILKNNEDLGFIFKLAEGFTVDNAVAVALKTRTAAVFRLAELTSPRL